MLERQVARKALYLQIATKGETGHKPLDALKKADDRFQAVDTLHVTLHPLSWWKKQFEKPGKFLCGAKKSTQFSQLEFQCLVK